MKTPIILSLSWVLGFSAASCLAGTADSNSTASPEPWSTVMPSMISPAPAATHSSDQGTMQATAVKKAEAPRRHAAAPRADYPDAADLQGPRFTAVKFVPRLEIRGAPNRDDRYLSSQPTEVSCEGAERVVASVEGGKPDIKTGTVYGAMSVVCNELLFENAADLALLIQTDAAMAGEIESSYFWTSHLEIPKLTGNPEWRVTHTSKQVPEGCSLSIGNRPMDSRSSEVTMRLSPGIYAITMACPESTASTTTTLLDISIARSNSQKE
jgi:hypothetical protein